MIVFVSTSALAQKFSTVGLTGILVAEVELADEQEPYFSGFRFRVIYISDSTLQAGDTTEALVLCARNKKVVYEVGNYYQLSLVSKEQWEPNMYQSCGPKLGGLPWPEGHRVAINIDQLNDDYAEWAMSEVGLHEGPMKPIELDQLKGSNYYVDDDSREPTKELDNMLPQSNYSIPLRSDLPLLKNAVGMWVDTTESEYFNRHYEGTKLYLYNTTTDTAWFPSIDSRLYMTLERESTPEEWEQLEEVLYSDCGLSYYDIALAPGKMWELVIPRPTTADPQRLRMSCRLSREEEWEDPKNTCYSNVFWGKQPQ